MSKLRRIALRFLFLSVSGVQFYSQILRIKNNVTSVQNKARTLAYLFIVFYYSRSQLDGDQWPPEHNSKNLYGGGLRYLTRINVMLSILLNVLVVLGEFSDKGWHLNISNRRGTKLHRHSISISRLFFAQTFIYRPKKLHGHLYMTVK